MNLRAGEAKKSALIGAQDLHELRECLKSALLRGNVLGSAGWRAGPQKARKV